VNEWTSRAAGVGPPGSSRRGCPVCVPAPPGVFKLGSGRRQGRVRRGRPLLSRPRGAVCSGAAAVESAADIRPSHGRAVRVPIGGCGGLGWLGCEVRQYDPCARLSHCSGGPRAHARPDGRRSSTANLANLLASVNETNQHGARSCGARNSADEWGKRARCSGPGRSAQKEQGSHIRRDQPQDGTAQTKDTAHRRRENCDRQANGRNQDRTADDRHD